MATQDNIAISNPSFAAEMQGFNLVSEKEKKKERAGLAHLAALLNALEGEMKGAKAEVKGGSNKVVPLNASQEAEAPSGPPAGSGFGKAMAELALLLQMLQVEIAKFSKDKSDIDGDISQAQVAQAKAALEDCQKKLAELKEKQAHESFWKKLTEALEIVVTVIVDVVAVVCCQPEIAVFATAMLVASLTGALSKATQAIASGLTDIVMAFEKMAKPHMSDAEEQKIEAQVKDVCEIVAAVLVIVVVIIAAGFAAPGAAIDEAASGAEEIATAAEEGTEMTTFGADSAEEGAAATEETTQTVTSGLKRALEILNKLRPSAKASMMMMAGSQAASQSGIAGAIADTSVDFQNNLSPDEIKKKKEAAELEAQIVMAIISLVISVVSLSGLSATKGLASGASDITKLGRFGNVLNKLRDSENFLKYAEMLRKAGNAGQGVGGVAEGSIVTQEGDLLRQMAAITGSLELIQAQTDMNTRQVKEDSQFQASVMKQQNTDNRSLYKLMAGEAAIANVLTSYSPV